MFSYTRYEPLKIFNKIVTNPRKLQIIYGKRFFSFTNVKFILFLVLKASRQLIRLKVNLS